MTFDCCFIVSCEYRFNRPFNLWNDVSCTEEQRRYFCRRPCPNAPFDVSLLMYILGCLIVLILGTVWMMKHERANIQTLTREIEVIDEALKKYQIKVLPK